MYIERNIQTYINKTISNYPSITVYGARQVGKSTMLKHIFKDYKYVTLDNLEDRDLANTNPKLFLENYGTKLIIDEIQKSTNLIDQIKNEIDKYKNDCIENNKKMELLYIVSGSNKFELEKAISESLAGRTDIINLTSLSIAEIRKYENHSYFNPNIETLKQKFKKFAPKYRTRKQIFEDIYKGGMPELFSLKTPSDKYFSNYVNTYIQKDITNAIKQNNVTLFMKFLRIISLRTAQEFNASDIASAVGVDTKTIQHWTDLLIKSGIIYKLEPYMKNENSRIIKSPKIYFMDTGLCSWLSKIPNADILENSNYAGAFYETYIVSEIIKSLYNDGMDPNNNGLYNFYYYRDKDQKEIDLIIETVEGIYPIEIKKGINPIKANKNFDVLKKYGKNIINGLVIDSREDIYPINENVYYCPISLIGL